METSQILYIVLAVIFGIIFGKLDTVFTGKLKKGREEKKEQVLQQEIERLTQALEQAKKQAREEASAPQPEKKSALRIVQSESGEWAVEIDGVPAHPDTLDSRQRTRLINLLGYVRPLIESKPRPSAAPQPVPQQDAQPAPSPAARPAASLSTSESKLPPSPLRANLVSGFRNMMEPKAKSEPVPGLLSIVALIDEILQKKIAGTSLGSRQVRLEEGALGEVIVNIGASRYTGIDSVPEPEIRAVIQEAIEEFNRTR
jgi:hypothetical protein